MSLCAGGPASPTSASPSKASVSRVSNRVVPFGKLVQLPKIVGNGLNVIEIERGLKYFVKWKKDYKQLQFHLIFVFVYVHMCMYKYREIHTQRMHVTMSVLFFGVIRKKLL